MVKVDEQIRLAKITAVQAIVVALIAAVAGIIGGYLGHERLSDAPLGKPKQWLTIDQVESGAFATCRIVLSVNGYNYSYPSTAVWARVGASPREYFALPPAPAYRVAFRAIVPEGSDARLLESPEVQEWAAGMSLHDQVYTLYPGVAVRGPRDSGEAIRLHYSIV